VLDEADRLLNMDFEQEIDEILKQRRKRCCCFWSRLVRLNDSPPYTCGKRIPPERRVRGRGLVMMMMLTTLHLEARDLKIKRRGRDPRRNPSRAFGWDQ
jgi:hypothetical protein